MPFIIAWLIVLLITIVVLYATTATIAWIGDDPHPAIVGLIGSLFGAALYAALTLIPLGIAGML